MIENTSFESISIRTLSGFLCERMSAWKMHIFVEWMDTKSTHQSTCVFEKCMHLTSLISRGTGAFSQQNGSFKVSDEAFAPKYAIHEYCAFIQRRIWVSLCWESSHIRDTIPSNYQPINRKENFLFSNGQNSYHNDDLISQKQLYAANFMLKCPSRVVNLTMAIQQEKTFYYGL